MKTRLFLSLAGAALLLSASPARAHHAFGAEFDINKPLTLRGTVVEWKLTNPHSWIYIDVKGEDGTTATWMIESAPPNNLFRLGFTKSSLPPGTELVVQCFQAKDGSNRASGKEITFTDGRKLLLGLNTGSPEK